MVDSVCLSRPRVVALVASSAAKNGKAYCYHLCFLMRVMAKSFFFFPSQVVRLRGLYLYVVIPVLYRELYWWGVLVVQVYGVVCIMYPVVVPAVLTPTVRFIAVQVFFFLYSSLSFKQLLYLSNAVIHPDLRYEFCMIVSLSLSLSCFVFVILYLNSACTKINSWPDRNNKLIPLATRKKEKNHFHLIFC